MKIYIALLALSASIFSSAFALAVENTSFAIESNGRIDSFSEDVSLKTLTISWGVNTKTLHDITGMKSGAYRSLVKFNERPSLYSGGVDDMETYYTLISKEDNLFVDCIYSDFRSNENGIGVTKAVCGVNKELNSDYQNLVFDYSNRWKEDINKVDITPLIAQHKILDILVGSLNGVAVYIRYASVQDLENAQPETFIEYNSKHYSLNKNKAYLVYKEADNPVPIRLDVVIDSKMSKLKSYTESDLIKLVMDHNK